MQKEEFYLFEKPATSLDEIYVLRAKFKSLQDAIFYAYNHKYNFRVYKFIENSEKKFDLYYNRDSTMTFGEV